MYTTSISKNFLSFFVAVIAALLLPGTIYSAFAATVLYELNGNSANGGLGGALAVVGDLNSDGIPEIAAGAPGATTSVSGEGLVKIFSGADGALLRYLYGSNQKFEYFGTKIAAIGDVNGDGMNDIAVSSDYSNGSKLNAGRVYVFSGINGAELYRLTGTKQYGFFGGAIASIGDMNQDGIDDFFIGESGGGPAAEGTVHLVSGASGSIIGAINGQAAFDDFGLAVASVTDLNGDGISEYAIGAPQTTVAGVSKCGTVYLYDGKSGTLMHTFNGLGKNARFGTKIAAAGDINGDGVNDIAIQGAGVTSGWFTIPHPRYLELRSGKDGSLLLQNKEKNSGDGLGTAFAPVGDFDNDGMDDLAVSTPSILVPDPANPGSFVTPGKVEILSYSGGAPLLTIDGGKNYRLGEELVTADLTGDGYPELIASSPYGGPSAEGKVLVYKLKTVSTPTPTPTATPAPGPAETFSVILSKQGNLTLVVNDSQASAACTYRIRAARREQAILNGKGRNLLSWSPGSSASWSFLVKRLHRMKGTLTSIWFAADRNCGSGGTWAMLDHKSADFSQVQNNRRRARYKRIVRRITKYIKQQ